MPHDDNAVTVTACPNGPLIIRGNAEYIDENGDPITQPRRTTALCRCGASAIKPWCDGTHKLTGFTTGVSHPKHAVKETGHPSDAVVGQSHEAET